MSNTRLKPEEIKEVFTLWDKAASGAIPTGTVATVIRACGSYPPKDVLDDAIGRADPGGSGTVDYPDFLKIYENTFITEDPAATMISAFEAFDSTGSGTVKVSDFKKIMTQRGNALSNEELNKMISMADPQSSGKIRYQTFVKAVFAKKAQ